MTDNVNNPSHYQFSNDAQVIDITENLNFNMGNVVKYVARAGRKTPDPMEDLLKARFYLDREIERQAPFYPLTANPLPKGLLMIEDVIWADKEGSLWRLDGQTWKYFDEDQEDWYCVVGVPSDIYEPFEETDLWLNA